MNNGETLGLSKEPHEKDFTSIGPGSLAGKLLRSFWQPVFLSEQLARGRARPLHILGEEFTIYRSEAGVAQIVGPYCPHRGLRLSVGTVEGDCIRCFYHGWKFAAHGGCVEQPAERSGDPSVVKIASYPTREYLGLIFAFFGHEEPPEFPHLNAFHTDGFCIAKRSVRKWPFFDQLENSVDEVHFNFTHRRSKFTDVGLNDEIPQLDCEETDYGILRIGHRGDKVRHSHILMPNCMYSLVYSDEKGWSEHLSWRVPIDDGVHASFVVDCIHKEGAEAEEYHRVKADQRRQLAGLEPAEAVIAKALAGEIHVDDLADRPDIVLIQDGVAIGGLRKPRNRDKDNLRTSDRQVILLRRLWQRELLALKKGKPIKMWKIPPDLMPTAGI